MSFAPSLIEAYPYPTLKHKVKHFLFRLFAQVDESVAFQHYPLKRRADSTTYPNANTPHKNVSHICIAPGLDDATNHKNVTDFIYTNKI